MTRSIVIALCLGVGWCASPASATLLFGVSHGGNIYKIDQATGDRSPFIVNTGVAWQDATDSPTSTAFFATGDGGSLYKVDVPTETLTPIGSYGGAMIRTLAYAEPDTPGGTGVLYGSDFQNLYTIDMTTGAAGPAIPIHRPGDYFIGVWSMDYDPVAKRLFIINQFSASTTLYYVDPGTGLATLVGALPPDTPISDIWYDDNSHKMYGMHHTTAQLYEINTTNAQVTPIGIKPVGPDICLDIFGLGGGDVPEPGTVALLGLGAIGLLRPRLRRRRR